MAAQSTNLYQKIRKAAQPGTKSSRPRQNNRIWEIDAFRGICILGVIIVHFIFDLQNFMGFANLKMPVLYNFIQENGGILFIILSGISATLGRKSFKRGLIVFALAMVISVVSFLAEPAYFIKFGILHFLGVCMMLYPILKKMPNWALAIFGAEQILLGYYFLTTISVSVKYLFPFGLTTYDFTSGDYFPLLPYIGYFMFGIIIGNTVYANKKSKLPAVIGDTSVFGFFRMCGRKSLWIYLAHQPIIMVMFLLLECFK